MIEKLVGQHLDHLGQHRHCHLFEMIGVIEKLVGQTGSRPQRPFAVLPSLPS
jgi:predicted glycoside hydrolase/deacetylase ChbG (UPF0249 family)